MCGWDVRVGCVKVGVSMECGVYEEEVRWKV